VEEKVYKKKKTSMYFYTSLKISIRNLLRTKLRTPLIIFAGSIGMIGIGLVLSIAKGVNLYIEDVQKQALANYPIYVFSQAKTEKRDDEEKNEPLEIYPDTDNIYVIKGNTRVDYYNVMDSNFVSYIEKLDKSLYTVIDFRRSIRMKILTFNDNTNYYSSVSYHYFKEMTENLEFMENEYELLHGEFPKNPYEVALVVSEYNSISASLLSSLGIDYSKDILKISDIINKEYRIINNDDYYVKKDNGYVINANYQDLYNKSKIHLQIKAIVRPKKGATTKLYSDCLLYSKELTDLVLQENLKSNIVQDQITYGTSFDVLYNKPFEVIKNFYLVESIMYQYQSRLLEFGVIPEINEIRIYTEMLQDRIKVRKYIDNYNDPNATFTIYYSDMLNNIIDEFHELVRVFSTVLIIFSSVSLVVSSIMIGIITYVSVLQRTKEIGLLRSIGARKKDIARLFNVETLVIGFMSGLIGIVVF